MRLSYIAISVALTIVSLCDATAVKCDADLTTKFAIGKRQTEKELECRIDAVDIENCDNVDEVNKAWRNFEQINDEYQKAIADCKIAQQSKRRRSSDGCGCNMDHPNKHARRNTATLGVQRMKRGGGRERHSDEESEAGDYHRHHHHTHQNLEAIPEEESGEVEGNKRVKRDCGCNHPEQHKHHHQKATEEVAAKDGEESESASRFRRHRQHNAAESQKHERGKHGRGHTPNRHGGHHGKMGKKTSRKHQNHQGQTHRRRHDHGSNDDLRDEEQVPEARDRSKEFLRFRRGACMQEGSRESERLEVKYASLCDRSQICDKDNLHGERKMDMTDLSKRRQRVYREYLAVFDRCYGSVIHH